MSKLLSQIHPPSTILDGGFAVSKKKKAGMVVFRFGHNEFEILLTYRKKQQDWSFPKGHVEIEEGFVEAALREVEEETGCEPMVLGRLQDLVYVDSKKKPVKLVMFLGYSIQKDGDQIQESVDEQSQWVPLSMVTKKLSYKNLKVYMEQCVTPVLRKKTRQQRARVQIIFSKKEPYKNGAKFLVDALKERGIFADLVELESTRLMNGSRDVRRIVYFLTNDPLAQVAAAWQRDFKKTHVINDALLKTFYSKSIIQRQLRIYGISAPKLFGSQGRLPLNHILKSEYHGMIKNSSFLQVFSKRFWQTYTEERIPTSQFEEHKMCYISGKLLTRDMRVLSPLLKKAHQRIQEMLGMDIFSTDIFFHKKRITHFYIVDVNPAPAFFSTPNARDAFVTYVEALLSLAPECLFLD